MKKLASAVLILVSALSFAQNILNSKSPEAYRQMKEERLIVNGDSLIDLHVTPLDYGFIEDKDILRSMIVWEIIDMNDRFNQYLYHDSDNLVGANKSLYSLLLDAVLTGKIKEVYDDEDFITRLSPDQIEQRLRYVSENDALVDIRNSGREPTEDELKQYTDVYETKNENVKLLKIKGMWYIDRRDGAMKYRLLGIAAMGPDPSMMGVRGADGQLLAQGDELVDLFWIFYRDARDVTANGLAFNSKNLSSDISYDDLLNQRKFTSVIYRTENGYGTGRLEDYIPKNADEQLEESERIKGQILEMENDMWNY